MPDRQLKIKIIFETGGAKSALREVGTEASKTTRVIDQNKKVVSNASNALLALNYTVRDSPYFFKNFSLGILAIGNNLNPLIDSLIRTKQEAKALNMTLGQALKQQLMSGGGLVFAFSVLVSVLQAVVFAFDKTGDESKKLGESIDDLIKKNQTWQEYIQDIQKEMDNIDVTKMEQAYRAIGVEIDALNIKLSEFSNYINWFDKFLAQMGLTSSMISGIEKYKEDSKTVKTLQERNLELKKNAGTLQNLIEFYRQGKVATKEFIASLSPEELSIAQKGLENLRSKTNDFGQIYQDVGGVVVSTTAKEADAILGFLDSVDKKGKVIAQKPDGIIGLIEQRLTEIDKLIPFQKQKDAILALRNETDSLNKQLKILDEQLFQIQYGARTALEKMSIRGGLKPFKTEGLKFQTDYGMGTVGEKINYLQNLINDLQSRYDSLLTTEKEKQKEILEIIKQKKEEIDELKGKQKELNDEEATGLRIAQALGVAMVDWAFNTKKNIGEIVIYLGETIAKMIAMKAIAKAFDTGTGGTGILGGIFDWLFANGGIVPQKANYGFVGGSTQTGDRIPVLANAGEMFLNRMQQKNLFNMINGGGSSNQKIEIKLSGTLEAKKDKFVADFKKAENEFNRKYSMPQFVKVASRGQS